MVRAKELSIQAANDTFGAQDREALTLELEEMKNEMSALLMRLIAQEHLFLEGIIPILNHLKKIMTLI